VINKVDQTSKIIRSGLFSQSEIVWLGLIGVAAAGAITGLRAQDELALLRHISQVITTPFGEDSDPKSTYEAVAEALTSSFTSYKGCVIRTGPSLESLEVVARGGDQVSWEERVEGPRTEQAMVARVFSSAQRELVHDIDLRLDDFVNREWILANCFKSFGCFPLATKDQVLGTLSLFIGYRHSFDDTELAFVESVASLLASFTDGLYREATDQRFLANERSRFVSDARLAEHVILLDDMRHVDKETLQDLKTALEDISADVGSHARKILENQITKLESRLSSTLQELSSEGLSRLGLNDVVQAVVRSFSKEFRQEFRQKRIVLDVTLDTQLPYIEAREAEIRNLLWNLLTNAIKAIEAAGRKGGHITVSTAHTVRDRREMLELTVEDDGIGIKKEMQDEIFSRGFTTFRGGTGFGLFSVQRTVDRYGGKVVLESAVGKGSTFSIRLPLKRIRVD
jgi:signal transduction histidine kinase